MTDRAAQIQARLEHLQRLPFRPIADGDWMDDLRFLLGRVRELEQELVIERDRREHAERRVAAEWPYETERELASRVRELEQALRQGHEDFCGCDRAGHFAKCVLPDELKETYELASGEA